MESEYRGDMLKWLLDENVNEHTMSKICQDKFNLYLSEAIFIVEQQEERYGLHLFLLDCIFLTVYDLGKK